MRPLICRYTDIVIIIYLSLINKLLMFTIIKGIKIELNLKYEYFY